MKTKNKILTLLAGILILVSCEKDYLTTSDNSTPVDPSVPISFSAAIVPIFTASCLGSGCHIAGGPPPILTADKAYEQITQLGYVDADTPDTIPANSSLYKRMVDIAKPMPPAGKLPASKIKLLELWIQQGAKNN
ncbi:MAG: hypothetical protein Q8M15_12500 [Bacteroidota bacterium]|nr:hypothetical protein [Bacteroidota bacterium]